MIADKTDDKDEKEDKTDDKDEKEDKTDDKDEKEVTRTCALSMR
jgi:hypothetical protein